MIMVASKNIVGVQYHKFQRSGDLKGYRLITFAWPTILNSGHKEVFEMIYTKKFLSPCELAGLYFIPGQKIILRCMQGFIKLFLIDLRRASKSFFEKEVVDLRANLHLGVLIPEYVVWGVMQREENSVLQIQTTYPIDFDQVEIINPVDDQLGFSFDRMEFAVNNGLNREMKTVQDFLSVQESKVDNLTDDIENETVVTYEN